MSGGGRSGTQTSTVSVPQYVEDTARRSLNRANEMAAIGYVPEYGPTIAAFTPMQEAAFQNTADAASAFGMSGGNMSAQDMRGGMDAPTTYAGGVRGYSSAPMYEDMLAQLKANAPKQYKYLNSFFIDPVTGKMGSRAIPAPAPAPVQGTNLGGMYMGGGGGGSNIYNSGGSGGGGLFNYRQGPNQNGSAGYGVGGYTSFADMFDGGGPGKSGGAFSGGGAVSAIGNALGGKP